MTLEQLLEKQEGEIKEFYAAQIRARQQLDDRHERMGLSGNDHYTDYQAQKQKELEKFHEEWSSEGKHATALQKRHEHERLKLSGAPIPKEPPPEQLNPNNQPTRKRKWRR